MECYTELIKEAEKARSNAYAPYSGFKVGAAILGQDGVIYTGCNVENASYGLSLCAERVAVCKAVCAGTASFEAIAVVTPTDDPASPCGACRQVLAEFSPEMKVVLANPGGKCRITTVKELLPQAFSLAAIPAREGQPCD